jgi:UDP:flavonoid glycosyltransferase YjiC (YdhE family)
VLPFVKLGVELKKRGHRVSILTNDYFVPLVKEAKLNFVRTGSIRDQQKAMANPDLAHPQKSFGVFFHTLMVPAIQSTYEAILRHFVPGQTVVIASRYSFGARIAQDHLSIPTASIILTPYGLRDIPHSLTVKHEINAFRAQVKLPPIKESVSKWLFSPTQVIGFFPSWFAAPERTWPTQLQQVGFPAETSKSKPTLPSALERFLSDRELPIVFTPGTAIQHAMRFFKESLEACRQSGSRALFVTPFDSQIPQQLPSTVMHVKEVSFEALFPRSRAVVHAGGIGTVLQAMAAGKPQLVVPRAFDQFDNAERLKKLGVGLGLPLHAYRTDRIVSLLNRLSQSPTTKEACRSVSTRMRDGQAVQKACDAIETLNGIGSF